MSDEYLNYLVDQLRQAAVDKAMEFWGYGQGPDAKAPTAPPDGDLAPMTAARSQIEARFGDISQMFAPYFDMPSPGRFAALGEELDAALAKLSPGANVSGGSYQTPVGGVTFPANVNLSTKELGRALAPWTGDAADAFRTGVLDKFEMIEYNQFLLAVALRGAIGAEQALWTSARHDIEQIAVNTKQAIDQMHPADDSQVQWSLGFTVFASVFAVVAFPLEGVAAAAFTIAAAASQAVAAVPVGGQATYSAGNPDDAISKMHEAITRLGNDIHNTEENLARYLREANTSIHTYPDIYQFQRPKLDDASPSNATSKDYFGEAQ